MLHQLEELSRSRLAIKAFASVYLMAGDSPSAAGGAGPTDRSNYRPVRASGAARRTARRAGGEWASRPLASHHYGYWHLGRRRRSNSAASLRAERPVSARQAIADWIDDRLTQNPIAVFATDCGGGSRLLRLDTRT